MLKKIKCDTLEHLIDETVPSKIRLDDRAVSEQRNILGEPVSESTALKYLKEIASKNKIFKNYIGCGYNPVIVPPVVLRNVLENPAWYTSYTPYQAEISQGRLTSLLNFQTLICELTGLPFSNASLLDEATSAAEAMFLAYNIHQGRRKTFLISTSLFPFIRDTIKARAHYLGIKIIEGNVFDEKHLENKDIFGFIVQNPDNHGRVNDYSALTSKYSKQEVIGIVASDIMSLMISKSPAEMGFDIAVGSAQRFGVPMMNGGPHAGFMAVKDQFKRKIPGRVIGVSKDTHGNPALRLSMQTREQHIRRDKATSNICTAQALLANMSAFYAIFHGKEGLIDISTRINFFAVFLHKELSKLGFSLVNKSDEIFDTVTISISKSELQSQALNIFEENGINIRFINDDLVSITLNETTTLADLEDLIKLFYTVKGKSGFDILSLKLNNFTKTESNYEIPLSSNLRRQNKEFLKQDIFNRYSSESQVLRYIYQLQLKDISLCNSMITLGSCTMKMNATSELVSLYH
jgi:glycine dehydrogenase